LKRKLINQLLRWKESSCLKPLLLTGAKGVGKTYLAYDFAKSFYDQLVYINFERNPQINEVIIKLIDNKMSSIDDKANGYNKDGIQEILETYFHIKEVSGPILVILDEISFCPDFKRFIKELLKTELFHSIIAISSIWGSDSDTDEKELFAPITLYPLDFEEFLVATGIEWYIEVIREHFESNKNIPDIVHKELLSIFELYIQVGGMPLAINEYIGTNEILNIPEQHQILTSSYLSIASRLNVDGEFLKIKQIINSVDKQLLKDNKKFQYTLMRKGATYGLYADAMEFIKNSYFSLSSIKLQDELIDDFQQLPEELSEDRRREKGLTDDTSRNHGFKLYMLDVGILNSLLKEQGFKEDKAVRKALFENYTAESLLTNGYTLYFWESNSQAKIDFVIHKNNNLVPIEVRINDNTRSKNVSVFRSKFGSNTESIKISTRNFECSNQVKYVPIYAVFCI
jgi:uncharacterized protein